MGSGIVALKLFEKYCKKCGYVYTNKDDVPDDEDVIMLGCDCGKIHILHRCKNGTYNEMGVREVHAHEHDDHKAEYERRKYRKLKQTLPTEDQDVNCRFREGEVNGI